MCARGLAHSPPTRMHLYALKDMYSFALLLLQCMHVLTFLSRFCCLLCTIVSTTLNTRGLVPSGAKQQFISLDKLRYYWCYAESLF